MVVLHAVFPAAALPPPSTSDPLRRDRSSRAAVVYGFWPHVVPPLVLYFITWWTGVVMAQSYRQHGRVELAHLRIVLIGLVSVTFVLGLNAYHAYAAGCNSSQEFTRFWDFVTWLPPLPLSWPRWFGSDAVGADLGP